MEQLSDSFVLAASQIAWVELEEDGKIVRANAAFWSLVQVTPDTDVAHNYWARTPLAQKNRELNEILAGRGDFEKEFIAHDGVVRAHVISTSVHESAEARRFVVGLKPAATVSTLADTERVLRQQNAILLDLAKLDAVDAGHLEPAFQAITEAAARGIGCERSSIWLYNDDQTAIICDDLYRISEGDHGLKGFTLTAKDFPGYFVALAEDRTIAADDAHRHPATREFSAGYLTPLGINSMLEAPIRRGGKLIGVLCNEHVGPARTFTQLEMNFAGSLAEIITRAMEAGARREADEKLRVAHAELAQHAASLEVSVAERTRDIQLILDNTGEGILSCDLSGRLLGVRSRVVTQWFGASAEGACADYLFRDHEMAKFAFELGLEQLAADVLPFELLLVQLPQQFVYGNDVFRVRYRHIPTSDGASQLLLIVRHATEEVAAEMNERHARELQTMAGHLLRDRPGFRAFVAEMNALMEDLQDRADLTARKRALHTLKGNSGIFGLVSLAELVHAVEGRIEETGELFDADVAHIIDAWKGALARLAAAFGDEDREVVTLTDEEYTQFLAEMCGYHADAVLLERVRSWRYTRASTILDRLSLQAQTVAARLGKEVALSVSGADLRVPLREIGDFWSSLVHVIRNAVDHGLETPAERTRTGKLEAGKLSISVAHEGQRLVVEVADDGRGIDWTRLRHKAARAGVRCETKADMIAALFADGISTRDEADDLSGRGVGLAAVLASCKSHGGTVDVDTTAGAGTTFRFVLPITSSAPATPAA